MHRASYARGRPWLAAGAALVVSSTFWVGVARPARADTASCVEAHSSGQRAIKAGNYRRASELFAACGAAEGCPDAIREECVAFYATVERNTPTVIFAATDGRGRDITDVRVYSEGQLVSDGLDGRALAMDIGSHGFTFALPGGHVVKLDVLIREGEKNRIIAVQAPTPAQAAAATPSRAGDSPVAHDASRGARSLPAAFWVATGVGAAALVTTGVFSLLGREQESKIEACSPACAAADRATFDEMRRNYLIADVSLGVAAASAGVAAWLFLSNRSSVAREHREGGGVRHRVTLVPTLSGPGAKLVLSTDVF